MSFLKKTAAACLTLVCRFCMAGNTAWAHLNKTILFVPHDNRPISFKQTADNIRDLGYEVLTPPKNFWATGKNRRAILKAGGLGSRQC